MIDGRLLLPAGAAWAGALLAGLAIAQADCDRHGRALLIAIVAAIGLAILVVTAVVSRPRSPRSAARLTLLVLGALLAAALAAGLGGAATSAEPLASWVSARATATVEAVVTGEPVRQNVVGAAAWRTRLETRLVVHRITARGSTIDVDVPMLLRLADGSPVPVPGSVIVVTGRLGPIAVGTDVAGAITPVVDGVTVIDDPGWLDAWTHAMRVGLRTALDGTAPDGAALVAGLAVGDESLQSDELDRAMRTSGLSHLTAVSGGNVAIVVVVVVGAVTALGLSLVVRVATALIALALFVMLVGPQPSVLRAAVMGAVVLAGMLVGGRRAGPSVLAASVIVLVIVSPTLAMSWAFALSVGATAGLILLAPRLRAAIDRWPRARRWPLGLRDALALTGAAQIATLPVLVLMGASVGWVALPANVLAMPAVPAVTVLGLCAAIASPLVPGLAHAFALVASWPASWIAAIAEAGSALPLATLPWPSGVGGVLLLATGGLGGWLARRWLRRAFPGGLPRRFAGIGIGLASATALLWILAPPDRRSWPPPNWFLIMCDVGQGDALLVKSGDGSAVVVDAGPDPDRVDDCLADAGVDHIPAVVLTHFHADHVAGLTGVLRGRDVAAAYVTPVRDPAEQAVKVAEVLAAAGLRATELSAGDERQAGAVHWLVRWPRRVITIGSIPNNASIVLDVQVAGRSVLLTGDIELPAQSAVLPDLVGRHFDVVKVSHHGSSSQDPRLATAITPAVALISVGAGNTYGHPADVTLATWQSVGALVARTDRDGDVAVVTTASGVAVVVRNGTLLE